ncbi:hypothetical protein LCGC14_0911930 [marine sediment metagenome]|uniref:Uncharacterized protein n=1 Tax=marine sediment metagenome TaxID=412755 RepID=A0A0F9PE44_9ZZZZ
MDLIYRENNSDRFVLTESPILSSEIGVNFIEARLLDKECTGVLWDNRGWWRVLTREVLQEGVNTYRLTHLKSNAPIAPHAGVFLWDQTISYEEANQRGKSRTGDSPGPENEPNQRPLET